MDARISVYEMRAFLKPPPEFIARHASVPTWSVLTEN